jgi:hypothetical protein
MPRSLPHFLARTHTRPFKIFAESRVKKNANVEGTPSVVFYFLIRQKLQTGFSALFLENDETTGCFKLVHTKIKRAVYITLIKSLELLTEENPIQAYIHG